MQCLIEGWCLLENGDDCSDAARVDWELSLCQNIDEMIWEPGLVRWKRVNGHLLTGYAQLLSN